MARDRDDDALSWGDENDPTYAAPHPDALGEDDGEYDIPIVDPFSSAAAAPPLAPQAPELRAPKPQDPELQTPRRESSPAQAPDARTASQAPDARTASQAPDARTASQAPDSRTASQVPDSRTAPQAPAADSGAPAYDPLPASREVPVLPPNAYPKATKSDEDVSTTFPAAQPSATAATPRSTAETEDDDAPAEPAQLSSAALITFGILGGIFLLYTVGWLVTFIRTPTDPTGLAGIVQNAQGILAIAAPALWFIVTLIVAGRRKVSVRVIWLAIGAVVLLPWPFLTGY